MGKFTKRLLASGMAFVMSLGVSGVAFAETTKPETKPMVSVQLNGETVAFKTAQPMVKGGRTFVPFRDLFESLGATVDYTADTKTISAVLGDKTVSFVLGSTDVTVKEGDKTDVVKTDAASFTDKGYTLVPLRFAAQTLGYTVGWDETAKTAIIADKDALLAQLGDNYTIMDKYLAYSKEFSAENYTLKGDMVMDMNIATDPTSKETVPFKATGTFTGITGEDKMNMEMAIKIDTDTLKAMMPTKTKEGTTETVEDKAAAALLESLKDIKVNYIMDMESGKYYFNAPILSTMIGEKENTWFLLDFNEMMNEMMPEGAGFSFKDFYEMSKGTSYVELMKATVSALSFNTEADYAAAKQIVSMSKEFFSDDAFKLSGDKYTSTYKMTENGTTMDMTMSLTEKDNAIVGYSIGINGSIGTTPFMNIQAEQTGLVSTAKFSMTVPPFVTMLLDMNMKFEKTTDKPFAKPADGKVIDMAEMMGM